ncbi:MAG: hypothetical protein ABI977_31950, partial [Acidobacteriota bacterium]
MTRHAKMILAALGLLLMAGLWRFNLTPAKAAAAFNTLTVTTTSDGPLPLPGSLRQAINDAAPGDTINFVLSGCPCIITLTEGALTINKPLTIQGPGARQLTITGNNASRVFRSNLPPAATLTLAGLTIAQGHTQGNGAGG